MKQIVLSILFLLVAVWGWNTAGEYYTPEQLIEKTEDSALCEAKQHSDVTIAVLTAANSCADVSVRIPVSCSSNLARRYRPGGFAFDKLYEYLTEGQDNSLDNTIKTTVGLSEEYAARLKYAGYYIYTLRRIII